MSRAGESYCKLVLPVRIPWIILLEAADALFFFAADRWGLCMVSCM